MIRKFIFLIISLFLFVPASYADDSSIVPAYQLFLKNNCLKNIDINSIKEYDGPNTNVFPAKTYLLNGNSIKEYDGPNTNVFPAKTYLLSF